MRRNENTTLAKIDDKLRPMLCCFDAAGVDNIMSCITHSSRVGRRKDDCAINL